MSGREFLNLHELRSPGQLSNGPAKVLVLLATYNGAAWIGAQCESILAQTAVAVRLVASDDGSSDQTAEVLAGFARLEMLPVAGPTGSAGGNFFRLMRDVEIGDGDFVAFSDQDDVWDPDKLSRACAALADSGCSGYSSAVRATYPNGRSLDLVQSDRVTPIDFLFEGAGQGCTFVLTRELFLRVQDVVRSSADLVREVHFHDWLVYALCRAWGCEWYFDPVPSMSYVQHGGNEIGARTNRAALAHRIKLLKTGWYARQVDAVLRVVSCVAPAFAAQDFSQRRAQRAHFLGRLRWASLLARMGRRRWLDRTVLAVAAVLGYV